MGDKQNVNFLKKMTPQAKKIFFFEIFFSVAHLPIEMKFFVITKISYLQPFIEIMGGQNSVTTTPPQPTPTTNTTDDHNSPSGFSESSG